MPVVVAVAVTWVGLMTLLVARARRHRRPGEHSPPAPEAAAPTEVAR